MVTKDKKVPEHERGISGYNEKGEELPDPNPTSLHVKFRRPVSLAERVRGLVRSENLRRLAEAQELETFDEADDFDIPDDPVDPTTPYEEDFDPTIPGITAKQQEIKAGLVEEVANDRLLKASEVMEKWNQKRERLIRLEQKKRELQEKELEAK